MAYGSGSGKIDYRSGLTDMLARLENKTGFKLVDKAVEDGVTFRAWCEDLGRKGLKVDGKPFTLDDRPAMAWLYDQIPSTIKECYRRQLVLMKCAQVGFTIMEILASIYLGLKFQPCTIGMFLPDQRLAQIKSSVRFMPIVRTVPEAHKRMSMEAMDGNGRKSGEGNVSVRQIGDALYLFAWTSGRATTESVPMDFLNFDEVQEMTSAQIEKTMERVSASQYRYVLMGSTANWPESDIHAMYLLGSRHAFHTRCPTCDAMKPLDDYFPACIQWDPEAVDSLTGLPGLYRYVCESGHWIDDPQNGEWVAADPSKALVLSAHFPQMLSPTITPGEIMYKWQISTDKKNFYNRVLGKPYLNPDQIPVTLEHMNRCVRYGVERGLRWEKSGNGTFAGIDQMGQFNAMIIKKRLDDGSQAVVHIEEIYSEDPFGRCSELMNLYKVACCVVEGNPNFNEAHAFAKRHPGRVFICDGFGALTNGELIEWHDRGKVDASDRRTDDEMRSRWTVKADQFRTMQISLARFTSDPPTCLWPDPDQIVQNDIRDKEGIITASPARRAFHHFTKTALVAEKDEETNQYKRKVQKVGIDPHFSYANQLCDVAWSRAHGTSTFILPQEKTVTAGQESIMEAMPGLPEHIVAMVDPLPQGVCGRCSAFDPDAGRCTARNFVVQKKDPGCDMFMGREYDEDLSQ